jgi:hypothetical protein
MQHTPEQQQQQHHYHETATPNLSGLDSNAYAKETRALVRTLAVMNQWPEEALTRAMFQSLFGTPSRAKQLVRYWCRTIPRINTWASLADFLVYLANAPALPCVRDHLVGGKESHVVQFLPFGDQHPIGVALQIPVAQMDPRETRAITRLLANRTGGGFRQSKQEQVFKFWTHYSFAHTKEAQRKLDVCRPVLLASAMVAVITQIRLDIVRLTTTSSDKNKTGSASTARTHTDPVSRARSEARVLATPLTYTQALQEEQTLRALRRQIQQLGAPERQSKYTRLGVLLLLDAFDFAIEKPLSSLQFDTNGMPIDIARVPRQRYAALRSDADILQFGRETIDNWQIQLSSARVGTDT